MTLAQITAVISLLLAFGVSPDVANNVQGILQASNKVETPIFGVVQSVVTGENCSPELSLSYEKPVLIGHFKSNCPIEKYEQWSLKDEDWRTSGDWHDYDFGTFSRWRETSDGYSIEFSANPKKSETYVLTFDGLTATSSTQ